eukprot:GHVS01070323.1.p1 GENE.GHVS01070323.1~~GHVS01070323.1.p1  ORF type:complete len:618 (+),score=119.59 GHVS01070323.1:179-2032(+)
MGKTCEHAHRQQQQQQMSGRSKPTEGGVGMSPAVAAAVADVVVGNRGSGGGGVPGFTELARYTFDKRKSYMEQAKAQVDSLDPQQRMLYEAAFHGPLRTASRQQQQQQDPTAVDQAVVSLRPKKRIAPVLREGALESQPISITAGRVGQPASHLTYRSDDLEDFGRQVDDLVVHLVAMRRQRQLEGDDVFEEMLPFKPPNMSSDIFLLFCKKPFKMLVPNYMKKLEQIGNKLSLGQDDANRLFGQLLDEWHAPLQKLFQEYELCRTTFLETSQDLQNPTNEFIKWKGIEKELSTKVNEKVRVFEWSCGRQYLKSSRTRDKHGHLPDMMAWRQGDEPTYEGGFEFKKLQDKKEELWKEIQTEFWNTGGIPTGDGCKPKYYRKAIEDMEKCTNDLSRQQRIGGPLQAAIDLAASPPSEDQLPKDVRVVACRGLSYGAHLWEVYDPTSGASMMAKIREPRAALTARGEENLIADLKDAMHKIRDMEKADYFRAATTIADGGVENGTELDPQTSKVVFAKHVSHQGGVLVELTDIMMPGLDLATYLNQVGPMNGEDSLQDAAWIIAELIDAIMRLGELRYILVRNTITTTTTTSDFKVIPTSRWSPIWCNNIYGQVDVVRL